MATDWKAQGAAKRQAILDTIPKKWVIKIPSKEEQRDVTGSYIRQFLTSREIEITETDAVGITDHTTTGKWSAVEVTDAFCHRAALAHQLVRSKSISLVPQRKTNCHPPRLTAYMKYSSTLLLKMQSSWTLTTPSMESQWGHYMVSQLVLKTNCILKAWKLQWAT